MNKSKKLPKWLIKHLDEFTAPPKDRDYDNHTMQAMIKTYNICYIKFKDDIVDRLNELYNDNKDEPNKNSNHMASMISGEIDGLMWVYELITGDEFEFKG